MPNDRITADDVALRAGVSRSTVSRAFSPDRPVQAKTRARILHAAQELGYYPNALAQALTSRKSQIVGIVMGELRNPIHAVLHQSLSHALQQRGYIPISAQVTIGEDVGSMIATFQQYQVGIVVLTSMNIPADLVPKFIDAGLQVLLLNRVDEFGETPSVSADVTQGGQIAARFLVEKDCQRIAIATGTKGHWTSEARFAGHKLGLESLGKSPSVVLEGGYAYEDGVRIADMLNDAGALPDGMLCPNDLFSIGFMDRLRSSRGMVAPRDIRVVGFDDIPMAAWEGNNLTTIRLPVSAMATRAAEAIDKIALDEEAVQDRIWIPCRLMERASA
jgi:DNA-binding LacI/PurR family transcriptional regulator